MYFVKNFKNDNRLDKLNSKPWKKITKKIIIVTAIGQSCVVLLKKLDKFNKIKCMCLCIHIHIHMFPFSIHINKKSTLKPGKFFK